MPDDRAFDSAPGEAGARAMLTALLWRLRRERLRYLLTAFAPFTAVLILLVVQPLLTGDKGMNGVGTSSAFGARYGAHSATVAVGLLLLTVPGLVSVFTSIGAALTVRNVVGAEAGRGGLEALLAAPYSPGGIAAALLGFATVIAAGLWALMSLVGAAAIGVAVAIHHDTLDLDAGYLALALGLPLLSAAAGTGLALVVNLLFPRLAQAGQLGMAGNGGGLGNALAVLPGVGALLALSLGGVALGAVRLLLIAGGIAALVAGGSLVAVARGFRPESVLES